MELRAMRVLELFVCVLIAAFSAMPALATECANAGAAPNVAPNDSGNGNAVACGDGAVSAGSSSVALGFGTSSPGPSSTALGTGATSSGGGSTALGFFAQTSADSTTALGYNTSASGVASTAVGLAASATAEQSTALGWRAFANQARSLILGSIAGVNGADQYTRVGIGTSTPSQAVDVERSGEAARFQLTSFTATADEAPQYNQRRARGTSAAPTAVQNNDNLGLFSFRGYNGTTMGGSRATITAQAAGNFTSVSTPTRLIFATTPVGKTVPEQVLVITPDGKVQVNGQNLNVPDYVFEDDYQLMPLDELQAFIDDNGHLPGIPSAAQVNVEGHDLAGSDMAHLRKIEELTLYTLQQEQRLKELQAKADKVDRLEALINLLMQERDKS
jgi:hypothetical protein